MAAAAASPTLAAPKPLRILILGGTGFTGPHQVRYALARGHKVTLFNRGREPDSWAGQVEALIGDRNTGDLKALEGRDWDVCIDNPTTLPFWVRDAGKVLSGRVGQYVFISTISVYAANDRPAEETAPVLAYTGRDPMGETTATLAASKGALYGPLKALSEAEAKREFGAETTIIRPGLIVGPGDESDRFTYWPVRLARGGEVLAPGDGSDPVQLIDARDLAEWTIRMAEQRTFGVFNATGPAHTLRMDRMLAGVSGGIGAAASWSGFPRASSTPTRSRPGRTCRSGFRVMATPPASRGATSARPWPLALPSGRCRPRPRTPWIGSRPSRRRGRRSCGRA